MQLRCSYCQTMFATPRDADLAVIQQMETEGMHHFDAHCPKCRKANQIDAERLKRAYPNWREELEPKAKKVKKAVSAVKTTQPAKATKTTKTTKPAK